MFLAICHDVVYLKELKDESKSKLSLVFFRMALMKNFVQ